MCASPSLFEDIFDQEEPILTPACDQVLVFLVLALVTIHGVPLLYLCAVIASVRASLR